MLIAQLMLLFLGGNINIQMAIQKFNLLLERNSCICFNQLILY